MDNEMHHIPITIDIRSAPTETKPVTTLFICTHNDHDLVLLKIRRLQSVVKDIHLYNFIINGIPVSQRKFNDISSLHDFLIRMADYSGNITTETYCPKKIAEFIAYHRKTEQDADYLFNYLSSENVIEHSISLDTESDQIQDHLDYVSINSLSGNYGVAFKEN